MHRSAIRVAGAAVLGALAVGASAQSAGPALPAGAMAYVLQADVFAKNRAAAVRKLAACGRDFVVIDMAFDGGAGGAWTKDEVRAIRAGKTGRKVIAYFSIGEAEDYRSYWNPLWDANHDGHPDAGAPAWLGEVNPDWPGNYKVRYWQPAWQAIILGELDKLVTNGFDGVYLDLVDAFETFEYDPVSGDWIDNRVNPETGRSYRKDMVRWVRAIAERARQTRPAFRVIPQNGSPLLRNQAFRSAIDGIGIEDLFTEGNQMQPGNHTNPILTDLARLTAMGKPVWVIEYGTKAAARQRSIDQVPAHGFSLLLTDRNLTTLGLAYTP